MEAFWKVALVSKSTLQGDIGDRHLLLLRQ
jgi:hypothetical protein